MDMLPSFFKIIKIFRKYLDEYFVFSVVNWFLRSQMFGVELIEKGYRRQFLIPKHMTIPSGTTIPLALVLQSALKSHHLPIIFPQQFPPYMPGPRVKRKYKGQWQVSVWGRDWNYRWDCHSLTKVASEWKPNPGKEDRHNVLTGKDIPEKASRGHHTAGACGVPAVVVKKQEGQGAGAVSQMQKSGWSQRDLHLMGPQQLYITFLNLSYFDI